MVKKKRKTKAFQPDIAQFDEYARAFGTARMSKLSGYGGKNGTSTGTAREAEKLYLGIVGYTRKYGTPEELKKVEKLNPAKLRWMYMKGILKTEEIFEYDDKGFVVDPEARINMVLNKYNILNKQANKLDRERRKARSTA